MRKVELEKVKYDSMVGEIREYFDSERNEDIGDLQGQMILDFILEKIAPEIYNQAVSDIQSYMNDKVEDMYEFMK